VDLGIIHHNLLRNSNLETTVTPLRIKAPVPSLAIFKIAVYSQKAPLWETWGTWERIGTKGRLASRPTSLQIHSEMEEGTSWIILTVQLTATHSFLSWELNLHKEKKGINSAKWDRILFTELRVMLIKPANETRFNFQIQHNKKKFETMLLT
jgi:hypothetical protein